MNITFLVQIARIGDLQRMTYVNGTSSCGVFLYKGTGKQMS